MSGTSMDAIDAVLVDFTTESSILVQSLRQPFDANIRTQLKSVAECQRTRLDAAWRMDALLGGLYAEVALSLLAAAQINAHSIHAIGCHGQTICHSPAGPTPFTLQIGDPNRIAETTGITTVADFRRRDIAAGGEGAPLVPAFHRKLFQSDRENRIILNLGGMANVTRLPKQGSFPLIAFDTGPGNILLDSWAERHLGTYMDSEGQWAAQGTVETKLLTELLAEPFFLRPPPKSTGREQFNLSWLDTRLSAHKKWLDPVDVQATLSELTAQSVARAIQEHAPHTQRVLVCGGGAHNRDLLQRLARNLTGIPVETTNQWGFDGDWVEAAAFAWLAHETLNGHPGNVPTVTGARHPVVLGGIYPGGNGKLWPR